MAAPSMPAVPGATRWERGFALRPHPLLGPQEGLGSGSGAGSEVCPPPTCPAHPWQHLQQRPEQAEHSGRGCPSRGDTGWDSAGGAEQGSNGDKGWGSNGDMGQGRNRATGWGRNEDAEQGSNGDMGQGSNGDVGQDNNGDTGKDSNGDMGWGSNGDAGRGSNGDVGQDSNGDAGWGSNGDTGQGSDGDTVLGRSQPCWWEAATFSWCFPNSIHCLPPIYHHLLSPQACATLLPANGSFPIAASGHQEQMSRGG